MVDDKSKMNENCDKIQQETNYYLNNGLITKIWGPPGWEFEHSITFGYPLKPEPHHRIQYRAHFESLGHVLPCKYCRKSYVYFTTEREDTKMTDQVFDSRENITRWFHKVHNAVNEKLGFDYCVSYEDLCDRFESFRAKCGPPKKTVTGCVVPLDYKAFSFRKLYTSNAAIVPLEIARFFYNVSKIRGFFDSEYPDRTLSEMFRLARSYFRLAKSVGGDFEVLKKLSSWDERNRNCRCLTRFMRENSITCLEQSGTWIDTPTAHELILLLMLSSGLSKTELSQAKTNAMTVISNELTD